MSEGTKEVMRQIGRVRDVLNELEESVEVGMFSEIGLAAIAENLPEAILKIRYSYRLARIANERR